MFLDTLNFKWKPQFEGVVLACMGDSITSVNDWQAPYASNWVTLVHTQTGIPTYNFGVSGHKTDQMLSRFDSQVLTCGATHCIIMSGINDVLWKISLATTKANITEMINRCLNHGIKPILMNYIPAWEFAWRFTDGPDKGNLDLTTANPWVEQSGELPLLRAWQKQYAFENNIPLIDLYNTEILATDNTEDLSYYYTDREHMNAKGNMVIAKKVIEKLNELFPESVIKQNTFESSTVWNGTYPKVSVKAIVSIGDNTIITDDGTIYIKAKWSLAGMMTTKIGE